MEWIYQAPILFFSVVFHEFAHGYTAHRHGDDTALIMGRLTLNPLPHIDFMGTILLPVLCALGNMPIFGWAKPVPINPNRLLEPAKDIFKVAVAGPSANFLLALIFAVIFKMSAILLPVVGGGFALIALKAAFFGVIVNLTLACFNLIPVIPLDGSRVLHYLLPYKYAVAYERHARYGMWILIGLIATGLIRPLILIPRNILLFILVKSGLISIGGFSFL